MLCCVDTAVAASLHKTCVITPSPRLSISHCAAWSMFRYRGVNKLEDMLRHAGHSVDVMYYETLDMSLPQLEQLKSLKVIAVHCFFQPYWAWHCCCVDCWLHSTWQCLLLGGSHLALSAKEVHGRPSCIDTANSVVMYQC
eukprot:GHUV01011277.1.p2 GENE.GHUV01011277.1~~GHUV01011277.1.p2  ORF type:complete len:140 (+),score=23.06 GHUV01011277.1:150-569(+)